jgi:histidine ammonia-lyase
MEMTGDNLTLADAERILRGEVEQLDLGDEARGRVEQSRRCLTTV